MSKVNSVFEQDDKRIAELQAEIQKIEQRKHRSAVERAVKGTDEEALYQACKSFTNHREKQQRIANVEKARKTKAENNKKDEAEDYHAPVKATVPAS